MGKGPNVAKDQGTVTLAAFLVEQLYSFLQGTIHRTPAQKQYVRGRITQQFGLLQFLFYQRQLAHTLVHHPVTHLAVLGDMPIFVMLVAVGGHQVFAHARDFAGRNAVFRKTIAGVIADRRPLFPFV
ncbi:hypothetical protein SDC9_197864 [bioreactor metagenome]|uniref:Uncharacterized protein n=1 Tax=bioreactor metagenome TaxID=1076179 RepID=A0A645IG03_9ZZZZ